MNQASTAKFGHRSTGGVARHPMRLLQGQLRRDPSTLDQLAGLDPLLDLVGDLDVQGPVGLGVDHGDERRGKRSSAFVDLHRHTYANVWPWTGSDRMIRSVAHEADACNAAGHGT